MTHVSDAEMQQTLALSRSYSLVLLQAGPAYGTDEAKPLIWEHGRRNMELRAGVFTYRVHPVRSFPGDALP